MAEELEAQLEEVKETESKSGFLDKIKIHKFKILAGVLGVLGLAGVVFGAYKFGQRKTQVAPTPVAMATPTPDPTANWKTCTNEEFGFSIKYPDIFSTGECQVFLLSSKAVFSEQGGPGVYIQAVEVLAEKNPKKLSFLDWLRSPETKKAGEILEPTTELKIEEKIISGTKWLSFGESPLGFLPSGKIYYASLSNDKIFLVGLLNLNFSDYNSTLELMLSTFKFLEESFSPTPTPNPITKNWKLYRDSKFAFTFGYPQDWFTEVKDFPKEDTRLINLAKQDTPTTFSLSFDVKPDWSGTGEAQFLAKNYEVSGVSALKVDPPKKDKQILDRYQTNIYFEKGGRVYVFVCVHNWNEDYLNTCNEILSTFRFLE